MPLLSFRFDGNGAQREPESAEQLRCQHNNTGELLNGHKGYPHICLRSGVKLCTST